jgi:hypothetical protein
MGWSAWARLREIFNELPIGCIIPGEHIPNAWQWIRLREGNKNGGLDLQSQRSSVIDFVRLQALWVYIVIGGLIVVIIAGTVIVILSRRRKRRGRERTSAKTVPGNRHLGSRTEMPGITLEQETGLQEFGLQFIRDSGAIQTFTSLPVSVGRSPHNDIVLDDETVSAQHARVYYDEIVGAICVVDLDSANGTWINDHPTRKNVLEDGARLRLGKVQLEFRDTGYIHTDSPSQ